MVVFPEISERRKSVIPRYNFSQNEVADESVPSSINSKGN